MSGFESPPASDSYVGGCLFAVGIVLAVAFVVWLMLGANRDNLRRLENKLDKIEFRLAQPQP